MSAVSMPSGTFSLGLPSPKIKWYPYFIKKKTMKKTHRISIRITETEKQQLQEPASEWGGKECDFIRNLLNSSRYTSKSSATIAVEKLERKLQSSATNVKLRDGVIDSPTWW